MKGTDVTSEQLAAADRFLSRTQTQGNLAEVGIVKRADIVHLMAWYAAVRLEGAKHGAGDDGEVVDSSR